MTKKLLILLGLESFSLICNVNAQKIYYENNYGVSLTEQEYTFITDMYWDGYQEYLTIDEYNEIKENNLFDK